MTDMQATIQLANHSAQVLHLLRAQSNDAADAFGTLCVCLWRMNKEFGDPPASIEELIAEVSNCLRSIEFIPEKAAQQ